MKNRKKARKKEKNMGIDKNKAKAFSQGMKESTTGAKVSKGLKNWLFSEEESERKKRQMQAKLEEEGKKARLPMYKD